MPPLGTSEQAVQEQLDRIRIDLLERGEYETAAAAAETLALEHADSRWVGNALLLAASCYRELARPEDEMRVLETFLTACPGHVQHAVVRRALETLRTQQGLVAASAGAAALADLQARLTALESRLQPAGSSLDDGAPGPLEMISAFARDMNSEVVAQRARVDEALHQLEKRLAAETLVARSSRLTLGLAVCAIGLSIVTLLLGVTRSPEQPTRPAVAAAPAAPKAKPAAKVTITPLARPAIRPVAGIPDLKSQISDAESKPEAEKRKPADSISSLRSQISNPQGKPKPAVEKPKPVADKTPAAGSYTVKQGDTLWQISAAATGSGRNAERIAAANDLKPPYNLQPGQTLRIPK